MSVSFGRAMTPEGRKRLLQATRLVMAFKRGKQGSPTDGGTRAQRSAVPVEELPQAA